MCLNSVSASPESVSLALKVSPVAVGEKVEQGEAEDRSRDSAKRRAAECVPGPRAGLAVQRTVRVFPQVPRAAGTRQAGRGAHVWS